MKLLQLRHRLQLISMLLAAAGKMAILRFLKISGNLTHFMSPNRVSWLRAAPPLKSDDTIGGKS